MKINNKLIDTNIITAKLSNDLSVTATSGLIPLNDVIKIGNKLTLSNNKIIIGSGVSKVKISGNMRMSTSSTSVLGVNLNIFRNGTDYVASNRTSLNLYDGISTATRLIEVQEGDEITLNYWKSNSTTAMTIMSGYGSTYLTVVVVE